MSQPSLNRNLKIQSVAAAQDGIITRRQLVDAGFSESAINRRIRNSALIRVHAGVYRTGPVPGPFAIERAALFACGGGVISHLTAARIHDKQPATRCTEAIDVTMPAATHARRRAGIRVHRRNLLEDEVATIAGIQITSVARTVLDLASVKSALAKKFSARAEHRDPSVRDDLLRLLNRYPRAAGSGRLRALVDDTEACTFTRSEAEDRLLALIRSGGLPHPEVNVRVAGVEVDFYWRASEIIVEVDGYEFHRSKRAFVRDRQRDIALASAGYQVLRLTWHQLTKERERTLVQLASALSRKTR